MRGRIIVVAALCVACSLPAAAAGMTPAPGDIHDANGLVYRYYAPWGYRFQPLLSLSALEIDVSRRRIAATRKLAEALLARAARRGDALYWPYDFSFGGGPASWTSGFTQAIAAEALARAGVLLGDEKLIRAADASFRGLRETLFMRIAGGLWIREYSFTHQVILNAQLQSIIALESYAAIAQTAAAHRVAVLVEAAARRLLPAFDLGCWGRYQLGGAAADSHYEAYHVELLRTLSVTHPEPIWRATYVRWRRCFHA
ncbi:MAG TPA: D-glucuronyl C5-epimerase family protein [Gaiellaceae bacterium]